MVVVVRFVFFACWSSSSSFFELSDRVFVLFIVFTVFGLVFVLLLLVFMVLLLVVVGSLVSLVLFWWFVLFD